MNVKDIFNSWTTFFNPSEDEFNRAKERFEVCSSCEFKKQLLKRKEWSLLCDVCGCSIKGKVYSSVINPCPKNKWQDVDKKYKSMPIIKDKQSFL